MRASGTRTGAAGTFLVCKLSHFSWCYYCKWSERSGNYDRSVWMSKEIVQENSSMKYRLLFRLSESHRATFLNGWMCYNLECLSLMWWQRLPLWICGVFTAALTLWPPIFLEVMDHKDQPKIKKITRYLLSTMSMVDRCWKSPVTAAVSHGKRPF